jgi:hypothetical protein
MTTRTDWRKTCAELIENVRYLIDCVDRDCFDPVALMECREHLSQTRTALAQPEPEGLTDQDLDDLANEMLDWNCEGWRAYARAVIAADRTRYARPTIEPVPVSERPWEREGWCDAEGRCWWGRVEGNPGNPEWFLAGLSEIEGFYEIGDWIVLLPHHALPVPGAEEGHP